MTLSKKDRLAIPRQEMPAAPVADRIASAVEVNLGLGPMAAHQEALRCLECSHPQCVAACPIGVKVHEFVRLVAAGDYLAAAAKIREDNPLPAITGRVCPQENQCEGACILGRKFAPLGIGALERFVADYERRHGGRAVERPPASGQRVAIIGSGPAGLAAAYDLALQGHEVVVFEALHEPGGVLLYGIPEFRLPKAIVREEIDQLRRLGVRFECNVIVGKTVTLDELLGPEGFRAVFIATGAGLPRFMGIPGEHLAGVFSANEFLTRVNLLHADAFPQFDQPLYPCRDRVAAVIGGGNTALDAVRTARRLGTRRALLVYRRTEAEMPARAEEIRHALEEGIELLPLTAPIELLGDDQGRLRAARCIRMELGPPDASGRRSPRPIIGSEFELPVDVLIVAIGAGPNPIVQSTTQLAIDRGGHIVADAETLATSRPGVFAGGDVVTGAATVILAMAAGRRAAAAMNDYLARCQESTREKGQADH